MRHLGRQRRDFARGRALMVEFPDDPSGLRSGGESNALTAVTEYDRKA